MKKIICFGDSNTQGNGTEASPYSHRYSNVLETLLLVDGHSVEMTNAGQSGTGSETMGIVDWSGHYDVVTVMIGTNDVNFFYTAGNTPTQAAARHRVAINALLAAIKARFTPDLIVWIITITPTWGADFTNLVPWTDLMQPTYNAIVTEAIDFCNDNKYEGLCMVRGDLCIKGNAADCLNIHLSVAGAAKLAQYIRNYITLRIGK